MEKVKRENLRKKINRILEKEKFNDEDLRELSEVKRELGYIEKREKAEKSILKRYLDPVGLNFGIPVGLVLFLVLFFRNLLSIDEIFIGIVTLGIIFAIFAIPIKQALKHDTLRVVYPTTVWEGICVIMGGYVGFFFAIDYVTKVTLEALIIGSLYGIAIGVMLGYSIGRACIYICKGFWRFPGASDENTVSQYFTMDGKLEEIKPSLRNILRGLGFYVRGPLRWKTIEYFKGERMAGDPNRITITLNKKNKKIEVGMIAYRDNEIEPLATDIGREFGRWFRHIVTTSFPSVTSVKSISSAGDLKSLSFKQYVVTLKPKIGMTKEWIRKHATILTLLISILANIILAWSLR